MKASTSGARPSRSEDEDNDDERKSEDEDDERKSEDEDGET